MPLELFLFSKVISNLLLTIFFVLFNFLKFVARRAKLGCTTRSKGLKDSERERSEQQPSGTRLWPVDTHLTICRSRPQRPRHDSPLGRSHHRQWPMSFLPNSHLQRNQHRSHLCHPAARKLSVQRRRLELGPSWLNQHYFWQQILCRPN